MKTHEIKALQNYPSKKTATDQQAPPASDGTASLRPSPTKRPHRPRWTEAEDQVLLDYFRDQGAEYCSKKLHTMRRPRSVRACLWRAEQLQIYRPYQYLFDGKSMDVRAKADLAGVKINTVYERLRRGFPSLDLALHLPLGIRLDDVERILDGRYLSMSLLYRLREHGITALQIKAWAQKNVVTRR